MRLTTLGRLDSHGAQTGVPEDALSSCQLVEQRLDLFQIESVETFSE
jgi:hypothetical protein